MRTEGRVTDGTLRLEEYELKLAVAQFLRSSGFHATPGIVRFRQAGGPPRVETVADIAVRTGRPPGREAITPGAQTAAGLTR